MLSLDALQLGAEARRGLRAVGRVARHRVLERRRDVVRDRAVAQLRRGLATDPHEMRDDVLTTSTLERGVAGHRAEHRAARL